MTDTLHVEYIPLDQLSFWDRNPKAHDLGALIRSFERHGFKQPPRYEPTLNDGAGGIVAGNGRIEALLAMRNAGHDAPRGIEVQDGAWFVPVLFGVDAASQAAAEAYGLDDNNMVMAGGDFTAIDQARAWNANYLDLLQELAAADEMPVSVDGDDLDALLAYDKAVPAISEDDDAPTPAEPDAPRASLADRFIVPPFSVLDARQGYWQTRKQAWIALGIQSELGRGEGVHQYSEAATLPLDGGSLGIDGSKVLAARNRNGLLGFSEQARSHYNASPGGSPRPATRLGADGKTQRGDGRGRGLARKSGQDLMRGEGTNVVSDSRRAADQRSNLNNAPKKPEWATSTGTENMASGTSIFDPVLCELVYRWFTPGPGAAILDPFAGGSVRGIVAAKLGYQYTGIDLRPEQIAANEQQAASLTPDNAPRWITGDSRDVQDLAPGRYDLIFSCPPYADLEVYSDDPRDLSTLGYSAFLESYRAIIAASAAMLHDNRFACFVVGDVRDPKGFYRNFVSDTIAAFQDAGMTLYNEAILVTAVGSLPIRVGKQFEGYRKLGKTHQNVLVFYKGDPKAIKAFGAVEAGDVTDAGDDPAAAFGEVL